MGRRYTAVKLIICYVLRLCYCDHVCSSSDQSRVVIILRKIAASKTVTMSKLMTMLVVVVLVCVSVTLATPGHYVHNYYKNQVPQENSRNARYGGLSLTSTSCSIISLLTSAALSRLFWS